MGDRADPKTPPHTVKSHHSCSQLLCFFFYCSGDHRALHSFPTRRSSDLRLGLELAQLLADGGGIAAIRQCPQFRSEEHTSELQSLRHLVCRLLLEKKNESRQPDGEDRAPCRAVGPQPEAQALPVAVALDP